MHDGVYPLVAPINFRERFKYLAEVGKVNLGKATEFFLRWNHIQIPHLVPMLEQLLQAAAAYLAAATRNKHMSYGLPPLP
jgi:hypothetical protein